MAVSVAAKDRKQEGGLASTAIAQPTLRVLELRTADGQGGGPEKTIFRGAALSDPASFQIDVLYLRDQQDTCDELRTKADALGVRYREIRTRGALDVSVVSQVRKQIRDLKIDIVHSHEYKSNLVAYLVRRDVRCGILSTAHGWTGNSHRERYLWYPLDRSILKRFPTIVSVSSQITSRLVKARVDPRRITTIPNGIDPTDFTPSASQCAEARRSLGIGTSDFVIGSVGRLERQKRFDLLIDAFQRILGDYPDSILLIAGEGRLKGELQRRIAALGLEQHCQLVGHVKEIKPFYQVLDLFVQSSDYEGTPNVVLEAMALRVPVIATAAGGTCDVLRDQQDGIVVPCGHAESLTSAVRNHRRDPSAAGARVENARKRVETDLSFAARNRKLEAIYRQIAGRGGKSVVSAPGSTTLT